MVLRGQLGRRCETEGEVSLSGIVVEVQVEEVVLVVVRTCTVTRLAGQGRAGYGGASGAIRWRRVVQC